eukprot:CAMPEP_0183566514 /NCGR_PEP_ID=MMETSP0371-20130417/111964_1 /TAXON_ID=268820 /ORGANISM="Peridinium aciculiferum, Strain PAER-2" /LENGTH=72 /DNA_ID=CAMNT_0025775797 /DNA_START=52 /DNA_END=268 /DNA_ORIENTATION=-
MSNNEEPLKVTIGAWEAQWPSPKLVSVHSRGAELSAGSAARHSWGHVDGAPAAGHRRVGPVREARLEAERAA